MEYERQIDKRNPIVLIISLAIAIFGLGIMYIWVNEVIIIEKMELLTKIIIILMGLDFLFQRIILKISDIGLGIIYGISEGKNIQESIADLVEDEEKELNKKKKKR